LLQAVGAPRPKIYINKVANSLNGALKPFKQRRVLRISTKIDFRKWLDSGYRIFPLQGKRPHMPSLPLGPDNKPTWLPFTKRDPTEEELVKWETEGNGHTGIAVITGNVSMLVMLDYDCIVKKYPEILKLIPDSPVVRVGKHPKWMRAYRFNPMLSGITPTKLFLHYDEETKTQDGIELLCDGRYFVADGLHPDTNEPYKYLGEHLLSISREDLPEFPLSTWLKIKDLAKNYDNRERGGASHSSTGKGGRHNELLELCGALYSHKIPDRDICYQLEVLDQSFPESYFKTHKNTAERMLESVKKTHERNHPKPVRVEQVEAPKTKSKDILDNDFLIYDSLPAARGKHADFIKLCLSNSQHDEPTLHFMSGMAWLSALLANRLAVKFRGTFWPANILAFGVADSGHGKNVPNKVLNSLLDKLNILGHDDYPSSAGLLSEFITIAKEKELEDGTKEVKVLKRGQRELVCVLDEVDSILLGMKNGQSFEMRLTKVVIQLFDASRDQYGGQLSKNGGSEGRVKNPYLIITGTTQPKYFNKSLQGDIIYKGIYQRCFIFLPKKVGNLIPNNQSDTRLFKELRAFTTERLMEWDVKLKLDHDFTADAAMIHTDVDDTFFNCHVDYRPIEVSEEARVRLEQIIESVHSLIVKIQTSSNQDDVTCSILSRILEKTIKAASIDWLSLGGKGHLSLENVEWGFQAATYNIKQIRNLFLRSAIEDTRNIALENDIARVVEYAQKNNGSFLKQEITNNNVLRGSNKEHRERVFSEAKDRGVLISEEILNASGRTATLFRVVQREAV